MKQMLQSAMDKRGEQSFNSSVTFKNRNSLASVVNYTDPNVVAS